MHNQSVCFLRFCRVFDGLLALAEDGWAGNGNGHAPYGFQNPSNIMRSPLDGHYYALISTWGTATLPGIAAPQVAGNCLIRTADLNAGPGAWRAWGGAGFNISLNANPYTAAGAAQPQAHVCMPVTHTNEYLSLLYSTYYKQYMTVRPSPCSRYFGSKRTRRCAPDTGQSVLPYIACGALYCSRAGFWRRRLFDGLIQAVTRSDTLV